MIRRLGLTTLVLAAVLATNLAQAGQPVTHADLVRQMLDLERLALLPQPGERNAMWASTDRRSKYDADTGRYVHWHANGDGNGAMRTEGNTVVMAEMDGPGVLWRIWSAKPEGGLKRLDSELIVEGSFVYSADHPYRVQERYFSGGGGLCSTITDYWRFAQMLLNQGEFQGKRLLHAETVQLMTSDHVPDIKKDDGFGLGVSVRRKKSGSGSQQGIGTFGWGGFWYTTCFVDPGQDLIGICMAQLHPSKATLNGKFEGLVRGAVQD